MQNRVDRNFPGRIKYLSLVPGTGLIVMSDMHRDDGNLGIEFIIEDNRQGGYYFLNLS